MVVTEVARSVGEWSEHFSQRRKEGTIPKTPPIISDPTSQFKRRPAGRRAFQVRTLSESSIALISKAGSNVGKVARLKLMSQDRKLLETRSLSDLETLSGFRSVETIKRSASVVSVHRTVPRASEEGLPGSDSFSENGAGGCRPEAPRVLGQSGVHTGETSATGNAVPSSGMGESSSVLADETTGTFCSSPTLSSKPSDAGSVVRPAPSLTLGLSDSDSSFDVQGIRRPSLPDTVLTLDPEVEVHDIRRRLRAKDEFLRVWRAFLAAVITCWGVICPNPPTAEEEANSSFLSPTLTPEPPCYPCAIRYQGSRVCTHTENQSDMVTITPGEAERVFMRTQLPAEGADENPPPYELHKFFSTDLGLHIIPRNQMPKSIAQLHALRQNLDLESVKSCPAMICLVNIGLFLLVLIILWLVFI